MTRLLTELMLVEVRADGRGRPNAFRWAGHLLQAVEIANCWRVHVHWWQREIWREHFKVLTDSGLLCTLYHDLLTDRWYIERVYD
jgi:hypothetical protein